MSAAARDALARHVDRLVLRTPLDTEERRLLLDLPCALETLGPHVDFVRPGDPMVRSCLVVTGVVARFAQIRDGSRGIVALHIPGDMADLQAAIAPRISWALQTLTPAVLLRIPHEAIYAIARRHPAIAIAFWRDTVADANILAQWQVNVARRDALARVAHLLCEMQLRYRMAGLAEGSRIPFAITQADLADALGLTPVHLNRVLRRLREADVATKDARSVTIGDPRRLANIAEFDPDYLQFADMPAAVPAFG